MRNHASLMVITSVVLMGIITLVSFSNHDVFASAIPTISITSPTNGATLNTAIVTVTGIATASGSSLQKVEVSVDSGSFNLASGTLNWSYTTWLTGGTHTIVARVTDNAGNTATTPSNSILTTIGGILQGGSITFDPANGNLYVANLFNVFVIDGNTNTISGTISAGLSPAQVAVNPANGYLYIINDNIFANSVTVFNPVSGSPVTTIALSGTPENITFDPANGNLYVSKFDGSVSVINGATNAVLTNLSLGSVIPGSIVFDSSNGYIYVSSGDGSNNNKVSIIDGATNTLVGSISFQTANIFGMVFDPLNNNIYVSLGNQTVDVVNDMSNTIISSIPSPVGGGGSMVYDSANGGIYMVDNAGGKIWLISDKTNSVITTIPIISGPSGIAFDSTNGNLYVTRVNANDVAVIPSIFLLTDIQPSTLLALDANATTVIPGNSINFTYFESNNGNVPLTNPTVTDDSCSPVTLHRVFDGFTYHDTDVNGILDPGEIWQFQCIQKQNTVGTFTHTATGDGIAPQGNHVTAPAYPSEKASLAVTVNPPIPDTILFGYTNATNISKVGEYIHYTYTEFNNGNVPLTSPHVTGTVCGIAHPINTGTYNIGDFIRNGILDPGEGWVFDCVSKQNATGAFTSVSTGHGFDSLGNDITAPAHMSEQKSITVNVNPTTMVKYQSATGNGPVIFSTNNGQISSFNILSQLELSTPPPAGSYPFGFFTWTITGLSNGGSATISIHYPSDPGTVYEKLISGTWHAITPISKIINSDGSVVITLTVTDGALGQDADQIANGQITDPGGMLVIIPAKVTGGGSINKDINFGFEANSLDDKKIRGEVEYHDKTAKIDFHSDDITLLSADSTFTHATIGGKTKMGNKSESTFQVDITDPDKTGNRDLFSITITNSIGNIVYHNSGTVKGHVEIHKINTLGADDNHPEKDSK